MINFCSTIDSYFSWKMRLCSLYMYNVLFSINDFNCFRTKYWATSSDRKWRAPRGSGPCRSSTTWTCWGRGSCWSWLVGRLSRISGRSTKIAASSRASARDRCRDRMHQAGSRRDPANRGTIEAKDRSRCPTDSSGSKRTIRCSADRRTIGWLEYERVAYSFF